MFSDPDPRERFLPEGPRAVVVEGRDALLWVNIQSGKAAQTGKLHMRFWDTGEHRAFTLSERPGFVLPTNKPGVVCIGQGKEVGCYDLASGQWTHWAQIPDNNPRTIINDAEVLPGGKAIVFGTKDTLFKDAIAELYLFTIDDRKISTLATAQLCSNGKVFMHDSELYLYDIDTPKRTVVKYRLEVEKRSLSLIEVALDLSGLAGFPDGMVAGPDASLIIAFYNPAMASYGIAQRFCLQRRYAIEEWRVPGSPRVTCPLFVNRKGQVLLVLTTADEGMDPDQQKASPHAGCLFSVVTNLTNVPATSIIAL